MLSVLWNVCSSRSRSFLVAALSKLHFPSTSRTLHRRWWVLHLTDILQHTVFLHFMVKILRPAYDCEKFWIIVHKSEESHQRYLESGFIVKNGTEHFINTTARPSVNCQSEYWEMITNTAQTHTYTELPKPQIAMSTCKTYRCFHLLHVKLQVNGHNAAVYSKSHVVIPQNRLQPTPTQRRENGFPETLLTS